MIAFVGSRNPIKLAAVVAGMKRVYGTDEVLPVDIITGDLPVQPMSMSDTYYGANVRAARSLKNGTRGIGVGLEGGLAQIGRNWYCVSWVTVIHTRGNIASAMGPAVMVPKPVMELVNAGMELGDADDKYFGLTNSKQNGGLVGTITEGLVTREQTFTLAVVTALCSLEHCVIK